MDGKTTNGTTNHTPQSPNAAGGKVNAGFEDGTASDTQTPNQTPNSVTFEEQTPIRYTYERPPSIELRKVFKEEPPQYANNENGQIGPEHFNRGRRRSSYSPEMHATSFNLYKNLVIVSLGMMGIMSAYDMVRYVESSINVNGLGTASLAADYATLIVCVLFLATLLMRRLGCKWTIVFAMLCFVVYFAAHYYPSFETLIPGGMFIGVGIGLVQTATNTYITMLALSYSKAFGVAKQVVINRFFGIFLLITFLARIWGNLTSSLLLAPLRTNKIGTGEECGRYWIPKPKGMPSDHPNSSTLPNTTEEVPIATTTEAYALYGAAISAAVITAATIAIFLDDRRDAVDESSAESSSIMSRALATVKLLRKPRMFLLVPLTVCFGMVEAYMSGDFTAGFVTCAIGVHNVGYVIICYGLAASIFSYVWGWLANRIGRIAVVLTGTLLDIGAIAAMLTWTPHPEHVSVFYVIAGVWGVADAVWRTQLYSFYGFIFADEKEPGFSNLEVWMAVGLVLGYVWHDYLRIEEKLIILVVMLVTGVVGYLSVEFIIWSRKQRTRRMSTASETNNASFTK